MLVNSEAGLKIKKGSSNLPSHVYTSWVLEQEHYLWYFNLTNAYKCTNTYKHSYKYKYLQMQFEIDQQIQKLVVGHSETAEAFKPHFRRKPGYSKCN